MFILATAWKDVVRRLRDPLGFLLWLGIPLVIGGMLRLAFGGSGGSAPRASILVVDEDDSVLSHLLLQGLSGGGADNLPFEAEEVSAEEGRARIDDGDASALLFLPPGFGEALLKEEPCTLRLVKNPAQRILPAMVEESLSLLSDAVFYAHRVFGEPIRAMAEEPPEGRITLPDADVARISLAINDAVEGMSSLLSPPAIKLVVEQAAEGQPDLDFSLIFFPSMLFMTLFFLAQGLSEDLWVERAGGTLRRALVTPQRASAFLAGKLLAALALVAAVSLCGLVLARFALGLEHKHLFAAVLWSALSGALFVLFLYNLQMFASSQRGGHQLSMLVTMPLLMLGGSFFPFEAMPEGMARIGRMTPNGWALEQFKALTTGAIEPARLALSALGLCAVCAALFASACLRLRGSFGRS